MSGCFGIDVGGTSVKIGHLTEEGKIIKKWEIPTDLSDDGSHIMPDIAKALKAYAAENGIDLKEMKGIGLALPGSILMDGTLVAAINIGWGRRTPAKEMSELMDGMRVEIGNDANVAALGEQWMGAGKGHENVLMVTLGTGTGGGIIINGKIHVGSHGAGAEIGHMHIVPKRDVIGICGCGQTGCLEQIASATGIVKLAKRLVAQGEIPTALSAIPEITAKDVLDKAKEGDQGAINVIEMMAYYLAKGLTAINVVADPEIVVIGGGVSKGGSIITDTVKKYYQKMCYKVVRETEIVLAELGNDAGMIGAARMVLQ